MIDNVTSEAELLSLVEEAYTQEEGRQIVANRYAYFLHIGCSVFCSQRNYDIPLDLNKFKCSAKIA